VTATCFVRISILTGTGTNVRITQDKNIMFWTNRPILVGRLGSFAATQSLQYNYKPQPLNYLQEKVLKLNVFIRLEVYQ